MRRRIVSVSLAAVAVAAVYWVVRPVGAQAPATRTISIATLAPPGSTWMRVFDAWKREVRRRSGGSLNLNFYGGGVQGDESEVIRKIRAGRIDGASVTAVGLSQIHRPSLVFQMPGLFREYAQLDRARDAMREEMSQAFTAAGFHLFDWADVGKSHIFSQVPVRTPQDVAAQKPWVWRDDKVLPSLYRIIRANPVPLQLPEVLSALQTNRVNMVVTTPVACIALQWCSRLQYMTDSSAAVVIGATVMGGRQWDALSPEHQAIMTETAQQFHALARRNLRRDETTALQTLSQRGINVVTLTDAHKAQWRTVFEQVRRDLTGQVADAALVQRVQALAN